MFRKIFRRNKNKNKPPSKPESKESQSDIEQSDTNIEHSDTDIEQKGYNTDSDEPSFRDPTPQPRASYNISYLATSLTDLRASVRGSIDHLRFHPNERASILESESKEEKEPISHNSEDDTDVSKSDNRAEPSFSEQPRFSYVSQYGDYSHSNSIEHIRFGSDPESQATEYTPSSDLRSYGSSTSRTMKSLQSDPDSDMEYSVNNINEEENDIFRHDIFLPLHSDEEGKSQRSENSISSQSSGSDYEREDSDIFLIDPFQEDSDDEQNQNPIFSREMKR